MTIDIWSTRTAAHELDAYASDVERASHQTLTNAIQRYVKRLEADPLGLAINTVLPAVDFDAWYNAAVGSIKSMVGSGKLNWPLEAPERVAMQAELLRRMSGGQIDPIQYTYNFHYVENRFASNIAQFVAQDFEPFHRDLRRLLDELFDAPAPQPQTPETTIPILPSPAQADPAAPGVEYVSAVRLTELRALRPTTFDLRKLIKLCEEIDINFRQQCYLGVAALTRALLDHVPPIFEMESFAGVANNYGGGGRSFRESMHHLELSARRIGDAHLHVQIRNSESLPTSTQVNFANDIDVLLAEVVRILR